jgi:HD superfamily phosphohydrolase
VNQKDLQKEEILEKFCWMDDSDIISSVKAWQFNEDKILSTLCKMLINRDLTGIKIRSTAFGNNDLQRYYKEVAKELNIEFDEAKYFVSTGTLINTTYSSEGSRLKIMYKNGQLKDIVDASEAYNSITFKEPQVKYFITYLK